MKINSDCLRNLLLCIEENTSFSEPFHYDKTIHISSNMNDSIKKVLSSYDSETISYHIRYCIDGGILICPEPEENPYFSYFDCYLSFKGHEFLDKIRDPKAWKIIRSVAVAAGSCSVGALSQAAAAYFGSLIPSLLPTIVK